MMQRPSIHPMRGRMSSNGMGCGPFLSISCMVRSFTLVTDHQPLKWLMESDKLNREVG